jgi:hypothetical protein
MSYQLTALNFAGGVTGGQTYHEENGVIGLLGYCICGWTGPLRTKGGYNRYRSLSYRDWVKHVETCDVANGKKIAPLWGRIQHKAGPVKEIVHSDHSWRAKCDCGWEGQLYWDEKAHLSAWLEAREHMKKDLPPVQIGGELLCPSN